MSRRPLPVHALNRRRNAARQAAAATAPMLDHRTPEASAYERTAMSRHRREVLRPAIEAAEEAARRAREIAQRAAEEAARQHAGHEASIQRTLAAQRPVHSLRDALQPPEDTP